MKYGLVLSGGGARGLFAVQILKKLKLSGFDFKQLKAIAGVSVGSIIGAMICQGDEDILFEMFPKIKNKDVYRGKISLARILWQRITGKNYVLDLEPLHELLTKYISLERAQASEIIFEIGLVNMASGKFETFNQYFFSSNEDYIRAIMASCAQPVIWKPQAFKTHLKYVGQGCDGGVVTISPIKAVLDRKPDLVIIINSSPEEIKYIKDLKTMEDVLMRTIELAVGQSFKKDMETFRKYNDYAVTDKQKKLGLTCYPYRIYQTTLHEDSLDFDSVSLKNKRIENANIIFDEIHK